MEVLIMSNKKRDWGEFFGLPGFVLMIGSFILMFVIDNRYAFILLCGTILGIILMFLGLIIDRIEQANTQDTYKQKILENKNEMSDWFDSKIKEYNINTDNTFPIKENEYFYYKYYYWLKDGILFLFPQKEDFIKGYVTVDNSVDYCEENAKLINIDISEIKYFKTEGDISYVTNVESTGINIKGAAIGAVVAGDAGMIIGSRPQIKSHVETKDNRHIELKYKSQGELKTIIFDYSALNTFRNLFPEKEYEYANFKSENIEDKDDPINTATSSNLEEKFEKLRSLRDTGLITEEEFSDKKKDLLKQI